MGETKRKFASGLKEHQKAVQHRQSQKSRLAEHCFVSGTPSPGNTLRFYPQP